MRLDIVIIIQIPTPIQIMRDETILDTLVLKKPYNFFHKRIVLTYIVLVFKTLFANNYTRKRIT